MGDDTIDALSSPSCAHYRTDGGRCHRSTFQPFLRPIIVQMGDAAIEAFPALPTPHYRTDGGCIVVQKGDAHYQHLGDALLPKLGTHCRTDGG